MANGLLPIPSSVDAPWYAAAREGRFLIQRSASTGAYVWYPRALAPGTLADDLEWVEAAGTGTLYSFSIVYRTSNEEFVDDLPYVLALVDLDEGVRVTSRVVGVAFDDIVCGMRLRAVLSPVGDELATVEFTTEDGR